MSENTRPTAPTGDKTPPWFDDVDPEKDYEQVSETWVGEPLRAELTIYPPAAEDAETSSDRQPKQFVLEEPDDAETMQQLYADIHNGNTYGVCRAIVSAPTLTRTRWKGDMTGYDRSQLFSQILTWLNAHQMIDLETVQAAVEAKADAA